MRKPKLRELSEAIRGIFSRPRTSRYPDSVIRVPEGFRGKPEFKAECVACGACAMVCPTKAIQMIDVPEKKLRILRLKLDLCIFCGECAEHCLTKAGISLSSEWDLAVFDRNQLVENYEDELVLCEICGEIISAKKHLLWVAQKLGAFSYAHPGLLLLILKEQNLIEPLKPDYDQEDLTRPDRIAVSCPRCRHLTIVREEK